MRVYSLKAFTLISFLVLRDFLNPRNSVKFDHGLRPLSAWYRGRRSRGRSLNSFNLIRCRKWLPSFASFYCIKIFSQPFRAVLKVNSTFSVARIDGIRTLAERKITLADRAILFFVAVVVAQWSALVPRKRENVGSTPATTSSFFTYNLTWKL